jgi:hypothetical protein
MVAWHKPEANMRAVVNDSFKDLSYYSLFDVAEKARWKIADLAWSDFDKSKVDIELITLVKTMTIGECTTFSATRSFMDLFADDLDFTQWLAVWFYEETKHPHVLIRWLSCAGESIGEQELLAAREITPMTKSGVEMLTFNIVSEIVAASLYQSFAKIVSEPLLKEILMFLSKDEMRHSVGFEHYCKVYINNSPNPEKEKLRCVRATWAFMQDDSFVQHPVYITLNRVKNVLGENMMVRMRQQIVARIAKMINVPLFNPEEITDVYQSMKAAYHEQHLPSRSVQ